MCAAGAYKNRYKLLIQNNAKAGEAERRKKKCAERAAEKKSLRKAQTSLICFFFSCFVLAFFSLWFFSYLLFIKCWRFNWPNATHCWTQLGRVQLAFNCVRCVRQQLWDHFMPRSRCLRLKINVTRVFTIYIYGIRRVRVPSLLCVAREFLVNVHVWLTECHQLKCLQCIFRPVWVMARACRLDFN